MTKNGNYLKQNEGFELQAFGRQVRVSRKLGQYGPGGGPTVVVIAGLHGNEPAGVVAYHELLERLTRQRLACRGRVIGLAGNMSALQRGVRYIDSDLNRLWRPEVIQSVTDPALEIQQQPSSEARELRELYTCIRHILQHEKGPFYFVDLHTTSSKSPPFIPFDDTLQNREFVRQFPVPRILGIEEYLPGTLLSYLVRYGAIAFGYEAGQHDDPRSVDFHLAMLMLTLRNAGILRPDDLPELSRSEATLRSGSHGARGFYEIRFRYAIQPGEEFRMLPGFESFRLVKKNQTVAANRHGNVIVEQSGQMFMPLYQTQGEDGFFLIRRVPVFWLELSKNLRRWRLERLIARLPGVQKLNDDASTLLVNPRTARFLSRQIFHLLGYRRTVSDEPLVRFTRRNG